MTDSGRSSNRRLRARWVALAPLLLVFGGAAAQAGNTVLVADMGTTLGDVDPLQGLAFRLMVVFWPLAIVGALAVKVRGRRFGIRLRSAPGALAWHRRRLAVGLLATALVFAGATLLKAQGQPLGTATLFSNSGGFVTAVLALFVALDRFRVRLLNLVPALIGLGGVYVAVAMGVPLGAFLNVPVAMLAVGCVLLGGLGLIQRVLSDKEVAIADVRRPEAKMLVALKISTVFGFRGALASTAVYLAFVPWRGWLPLDGDVVRAGILLAACYAASQLLLQAGNGFGNPGINGPMMYWAVPIGYVLDELRGVDGFTPQHLAGSGVILVAALVTLSLAIWRSKSGSKGASGT